jgi:hypothetical protein
MGGRAEGVPQKSTGPCMAGPRSLVDYAAMPAEGPTPHGRVLDTLRTALAELQSAAQSNPNDPVLFPAIGHVAAAVALLEMTVPLEEQPIIG